MILNRCGQEDEEPAIAARTELTSSGHTQEDAFSGTERNSMLSFWDDLAAWTPGGAPAFCSGFRSSDSAPPHCKRNCQTKARSS